MDGLISDPNALVRSTSSVPDCCRFRLPLPTPCESETWEKCNPLGLHVLHPCSVKNLLFTLLDLEKGEEARAILCAVSYLLSRP